MSFLLLANFTVEPLILSTKYKPSSNNPVSLTNLVFTLPDASTYCSDIDLAL
jgi:hypothetical protein